MPTNFPTSLDSFVNPTQIGPGQFVWDDGTIRDAPSPPANILVAANPALTQTRQHTDKNDAIVAIEEKIGVDGSSDITTIDYLLKNTSSIDPGHKHDLSSTSTIGSLPLTNGGMGGIDADSNAVNWISNLSYSHPSDSFSAYIPYYDTSFGNGGSLTVNDIYLSLRGDISADLSGGIGLRRQYRSVSTNYTLLSPLSFFAPHDSMVGVDASSGVRTVTMPLVSSAQGKLFIITKTDASANAVTIQGSSGQLINGVATQSLSNQYSTIGLYATPSEWYIAFRNL